MIKRVNIFPLVKLSFFAMLFYSSFLMEMLEVRINNMTLLLGVLTAVLMLADMAVMDYNPMQVITSDVKRLLLFAVVSALTCLIAVYPASAMNGVIQLAQSLLLMVIAIYICVRDGSITFCACTIVIVMAIATVSVLMNAESFANRLALSETGNANVFGHNAVLGTCLATLAFRSDTRLKKLFHVALGVIFALGVLLSASRMSFLALIGYYAAFLLAIVPRRRTNTHFSGGLRFLGAMAVVAVLVTALIPFLQETLIIDRMEELLNVLDTGDGDGAARVYLYQEAWRTFLKHPVFGVGYANFGPMHHGVYTHSTYAETLSCTGILGFGIFMAYYLYLFRQLRQGIQLDKQTNIDTNRRLMLVFLVLLLLGIGEILIYKIKYFVVFGMLAAQFIMNRQRAEAISRSIEGEVR